MEFALSNLSADQLWKNWTFSKQHPLHWPHEGISAFWGTVILIFYFWTIFALLHSSFLLNLWENNFHFKKKERMTFPLFFVDQYLCNIFTTPERTRRLVWTQGKDSRHLYLPTGPIDQSKHMACGMNVPHVEWITGDQWNETKQVTACIATRSHFHVTFSRLVGSPWSHMLMHFSILWRAIIVKRGILIQKTLLLNSELSHRGQHS